MEYELIRSRRRSIGLEIRLDGHLVVKAPLRAGKDDIEKVLAAHRRWIENHTRKAEMRRKAAAGVMPVTSEEIKALADRAVSVIPARVAYFAPLVGVTYNRITIRNQRTRWGSCSSKGNLNFNCLLMLTPPEVIDSVVVHELCHRKEMNHSDRFYKEVLRVFPDYYKWDGWLKENGPAIMQRVRV